MHSIRLYPWESTKLHSGYKSAHYKTWTLDCGLDHGLDSGFNNVLDSWTRILINGGQKSCTYYSAAKL